MGFEPTSSEEFTEERLAGLVDFRCEVCQTRYPMTQHVLQDGHSVCKVNCAYKEAPSERAQLHADAKEEAVALTAATIEAAAVLRGEAPNSSLMRGVSACTGLASASETYPEPIRVTAGGAAVDIELTGIEFSSSSDELTASHAEITYGAATISDDQTTWTTTVSASGGVPAGYYTFLFNGTRYPRAFRVL